MKPFVSVIIPVYHDTERLKICLRALSKQSYSGHDFEIIIINNDVECDLEGLAELQLFTSAYVETESKPSQFSARNKGVTLAKGEILAFLDSDCVPEMQWLEKGVKTLLSNDHCGIVGGAIKFMFQKHTPNSVELYDSLFFLQQKRYVEEIKFAVTANLFTFKAVFDKVGLFNEALKSGGDGEWGRRVFSAGYALVFAPEAIVGHPARHSLFDLLKKIRRVTGGKFVRECRGEESVVRFWKKNIQESLFCIKRVLRLRGVRFNRKIALLVVEGGVQFSRTSELMSLRYGKSPERQ